MATDRRLCLFARAPRKGQVKRRLAAALGSARALAAHEELLKGAIDRCFSGAADGRTQRELWLTELEALPDWLTGPAEAGCYELCAQGSGDLGERMWDVLCRGLRSSRCCVLFGSDCPDIDSTYLTAAFDALDQADVVIGPAEDGGYGLIGLSRPLPELFLDMQWGDPGVLARTLQRAADADATVVCLPEIYDVDLIDDWRRYRRANPDPMTGSATE